MTDPFGALALILNRLEDLELPLLSWGLTEAALSHDEVREVLQAAVDDDFAAGRTDGPDEAVYLAELLRRALLHRVPGTSPPQYRTRLAESVRLLASLRQLFPPRGGPGIGWWRAGAPLVADYRLRAEPRRYPRRDFRRSAVVAELASLNGWDDMWENVVAALLGGRDLARFQLTATTEILRSLGGTATRGFIVGAGTGSGKTLAFYLPALLALLPSLRNKAAGPHTLAIYPRKELLRDQAREAYVLARRLDPALTGTSSRRLRIGLLYGGTPKTVHDVKQLWTPSADGVKCPYFPCPVDDCGGDLVWPDADRLSGAERLRCARCGTLLPEGSVALTRDSLLGTPPDILFTTTEMLNRNATHKLGRLLGWSGHSTPRCVLLDEAHTYTGVHGAQVALTLLRWRHSLRQRGVRSPVFVGLSATLKDPVPFFASLTGLPEKAVDYICPTPAELVPSGRQYSLVVRGDPVSGTSLLSVTLQTAMLLGRVLAPMGQEGLFGSSGFVFTDDLDVTNRLYNDLRDAEGGQYRSGTGKRIGKEVLAQLRSPNYPIGGITQELERYRAGQAWHLVQEIGHPLSADLEVGGLRIGRTSSQDAGVDAAANLIVATASLEVGFNDPRVGLVLQHKAPRDSAAFLQRKGRAGRSAEMRPFTVAVLSDYGRDRLVYQAYEQLFDPEFAPRRLPVGNRSVLKIQAAEALLDWLTAAVPGNRADSRWILRTPNAPGEVSDRPAHAMKAFVGMLERLLTDAQVQADFAAHLQAALQISPEQAQAVLWDEPRSILLSAVPATLRRLQAGWRTVNESADPGFRPGEVLPEHRTASLFAPLNVPDVVMELPFSTKNTDVQTMPILSALREAVPGRVSRRFGVERDKHRTWLPVPAGGRLELTEVVSRGQRLGCWTAGGEEFEVIRPLALKLAEPDTKVADSSNAAPVWRSELSIPRVVSETETPHFAPWNDLVLGLQFNLHLTGDEIEVHRFTIGATGEIRTKQQTSFDVDVRYTDGGKPAALGFLLEVDAMIVDCRDLRRSDTGAVAHLASPGWRTLCFATRIAEDPRLDGIANAFHRQWLALLYLTAYSTAASRSGDPHASVGGGKWATDLGRTLQILYRSRELSDVNNAGLDRLVQRLTDLTSTPMVADVVEQHAALLGHADIVEATWDLARRAYADTLAAAVRHAVARIVPDAEDSDLVVDVLPGAEPNTVRVVVSETQIGGLGLMEELRAAYGRDPRRFWSAATAAVRPTEYEELDASLRRLLSEVTNNPEGHCAETIRAIRGAASIAEADAGLAELRAAWTELGPPPRHLAVSAFSARFLRPGGKPTTDRIVADLMEAWDSLETTIGAEVDARVIAYAAGEGALGRPQETLLPADQIFSLLWARGSTARDQELAHWQPYHTDRLLDRALLSNLVERPVVRVDVSSSTWVDQYVAAFGEADIVDLVAANGSADCLAAALRRTAAIPVDRGPLRVNAQLERMHSIGVDLAARVTLAEAHW
ncbi:protein DpdJ [Micromonospora sp. NPDC005113]